MFFLAALVTTLNCYVGMADHTDLPRGNEGNDLQFIARDIFYIHNDTAVFNCTVNWSAGLVARITWYKDNNFIQWYKRSPREIYTDNGLVMALHNYSNRDAGLYRCVVNVCFRLSADGICSTDRKIEHEFIRMPSAAPYITTSFDSPLVKNVSVGEIIKLRCYVSRIVSTSYKWFHNGTEVVRSKDFRIRRFQFLKITATRNNSGTYTCFVGNKYGISNVTFHVNIVKKNGSIHMLSPRITDRRRFIVGYLGDAKKIKCAFIGSSPFNVTWYKYDRLITAASRERHHYYNFQDNGLTLRIGNLYPFDCGVYTCIVRNHYGGDNRSVEIITLDKIQSGPYFKRDHAAQYLGRSGEDIEVDVDVLASQNAKYSLIQHHSAGKDEFVEDKDIIVKRVYDDSSLTKCHKVVRSEKVVIRFCNITWYDYANYSLVATNSYGKSTYRFEIIPESDLASIYDNEYSPSKVVDANILAGAILASLILVLIPVLCYCRRKSLTKNVYIVDEETFSLPTVSETTDPTAEIPYQHISFLSVLGEGEFGRVMLGEVIALPNRRLDKPLKVAIKTTKEGSTRADVIDFLSEIDTMSAVGAHPNVIALLGKSSYNEQLFMILEYCCHGNLKSFMQTRNDHASSESFYPTLVLPFCLQIAQGMEFLEAQRCIHRDLAARNILVADGFVMKICDFGLARNVCESDYYRKITAGRLPIKWMAIEAIFERFFSSQSDVWSFGVVCWEVCTCGGTPYIGLEVTTFCNMLRRGYRLSQPHSCPDEFYSLMVNCWNENPYARPSFSNIVFFLSEFIRHTNNEQPLLENNRTLVTSASSESLSYNVHNYDVVSFNTSSRTIFTNCYQHMSSSTHYENASIRDLFRTV